MTEHWGPRIYAGLVIGLPLLYVVWQAARLGPRLRPLAVSAGILLVVSFPAFTVPTVWLLLFVVMAICLATFTAFNAISLWTMCVRRSERPGPAARAPGITVLIPARDEARVIAGCLDALLASRYPADQLDIVVIDDGSTDRTADIAKTYQHRHANVRAVVRSPDAVRGKAAALNDVIPTIDRELTCIIDADHQVSDGFFATLIGHFDDPRVGGVQARITGRNWTENLLTRLVTLELLGWQYSFLDSKSRLRLVPVLFGSGCLVQTHLLQRLGGFDNDLATEDVEFSFRLYEAGYRLTFEPAAYTTDEVVADSKSFFRQRYRWARGTTQAVKRHAVSFFRGRARLREKLDFFFYPVLLAIMIVPYLQVVTHALALAADVDLPWLSAVPLCYGAVTLASYVVAGVRNRQQGRGHGPRKVLDLVLLDIGLCVYYALLVLPSGKAFIDEFILGVPYRPVKTPHTGGSKHSWRAPRRFRAPSTEEEVLLALAAAPRVTTGSPPIAALERVDWERVEQLARFHGVGGRVHSALTHLDLEAMVPDGVRRSLHDFRRMVLARNMLLTSAWNDIAQAFSRASIAVIPLKGISFIGRHCAPDVRPLHDLDVLVQQVDADRACRVLESLGYREIQPDERNQRARTQRAFANRGHGAAVDLHWDLVNRTAYNCVYALPIADVWKRARRADGELHVWELAPEDLFLHTALHCAVHHGFTTLSQLIDLAEVAQRHAHALDWRRIADLATEYRVKHPLYFALTLSREFVPEGGVPQEALTSLQPPIYRRLCFDAYLWAQRATVDRRTLAVGRQLHWGKDLKWAGWAGVIVADTFADSLRVSWRTLAIVSAESLRSLRRHRRARAAA